MIVVTTNEVAGHEIDRVFGEVMGLSVRARDVGANWTASWRAMGGGEIPEFTRLLHEARMQVMGRMVDEALALGANAIVAMRFDTSEIANAWTEVCAYGTAVWITRPDGGPVAVQAIRGQGAAPAGYPAPGQPMQAGQMQPGPVPTGPAYAPQGPSQPTIGGPYPAPGASAPPPGAPPRPVR